jgi:hypothetical protein
MLVGSTSQLQSGAGSCGTTRGAIAVGGGSGQGADAVAVAARTAPMRGSIAAAAQRAAAARPDQRLAECSSAAAGAVGAAGNFHIKTYN